MTRFSRDDTHPLLKRYGVRQGDLWYFRDGVMAETPAEKPPNIFLTQRLNEPKKGHSTDWYSVGNLRNALLNLTGLGGKSWVQYDGPANLPRMCLSFDWNNNFGPSDNRLTVGVFLRFQTRSGGKYSSVWSNDSDFIRIAELVAMQKTSGQEFLQILEKRYSGHDYCQLHVQNVYDYQRGILA